MYAEPAKPTTATWSALTDPEASALETRKLFRARAAERRKSPGSVLDMDPELSMTMTTFLSPLLLLMLRPEHVSSPSRFPSPVGPNTFEAAEAATALSRGKARRMITAIMAICESASR